MKVLVIPVLAILLSCGSAPSGGKPSANRAVLTTEELNKIGASDAYTAVQTLRSNWLMTRGTASINIPESIKVYLDGNLMGGPEFLRQITTHSIRSMRRLDGIEATQRYGLDHGQGAILVFTRPGQQ